MIPKNNFMYSQNELSSIRSILGERRKPSEKHIAYLASLVEENQIIYYVPFWQLIDQDRNLFNKIVEDKLLNEHTFLVFAPELYDMFYNSKENPLVEYIESNRGMLTFIKNSEKERVFKSKQSDSEHIITDTLNTLGIKPQQFESLNGFLTEEYVEGQLLTKEERLNEEAIFNLGKYLGHTLSTMHKNDIVYNDTLLTGINNSCNLMMSDNKEGTLIDFGNTINISSFPDLSNETLYHFLYSSEYYFQLKIDPQNTINYFRKNLQSMEKEHIIQKDLDFIDMGLKYSQKQIPQAELFIEGFNEKYHSKLKASQ